MNIDNIFIIMPKNAHETCKDKNVIIPVHKLWIDEQ